ncbi:PepSY-associated TM helix domain-containing protein [Chitinophagaceae bacterium MMS25-I14]
MTFKKLIGKIHLWLGLTSGLVVFIAGLTGCLFAFEHEIFNAVHKDVLYIRPEHKTALPLSELWNHAQVYLGNDKPVRYATIYKDPARTWTFRTYDANPNAFSYFGYIKYARTVFINPYTGAITGSINDKYEFFNMVKWLHWSLWLNSNIGQPIVGTATLIFVLMLVSGLILWWPRNKAARKQRFKVKWNAARKRLNYDLHNIFGFYAMIFAMAIALTGMVMAFDWFSKSVRFAATGKSQAVEKPVLSQKPHVMSANNALDKALEQTWNICPAAVSVSTAGIPPGAEQSIQAEANEEDDTYYHYNVFFFNRYTGALLKASYYRDKTPGEKFVSMNYDMHVGAAFGMPGKILAFFASLVATSLPVTGVMIWLGRKKKKKPGKEISAKRKIPQT